MARPLKSRAPLRCRTHCHANVTPNLQSLSPDEDHLVVVAVVRDRRRRSSARASGCCQGTTMLPRRLLCARCLHHRAPSTSHQPPPITPRRNCACPLRRKHFKLVMNDVMPVLCWYPPPHCRRVAGVSRLLHYHANVRSPQRRTHANDSLRLGLWYGIGVVHVHASPKSVSSGAVSASVVEAPLLVSLTVTVVVKRSQLSVPLRSQSSTQVMPVLTHAILAESSSRASWSLPQQPSSCCRAPVSIHRTMSCSGVPTFTGPRHKWSSHRREFICPGPIREALLKCVLLVTSNCATSRNASSEHKLEGCRRRRAMPCQRHNPQQNLSRATTQ